MRKIALILGILSLSLRVVTVVRASCTQDFTLCLPPRKTCELPEEKLCCDTPQECNTLQSEQSKMPKENIKTICNWVPEGPHRTTCIDCFEKGNAWTAIGCIETTPEGFIQRFLNLGVGIAGGIAFLLILFAGFQMMTSAGNPEKLNAGKELLTAAISGLILIVFSLFLLRLIGFNILRLPDFGE